MFTRNNWWIVGGSHRICRGKNNKKTFAATFPKHHMKWKWGTRTTGKSWNLCKFPQKSPKHFYVRVNKRVFGANLWFSRGNYWPKFVFFISRHKRGQLGTEISCDCVHPRRKLRMEFWKSLRRQRPSQLWRRRRRYDKLPAGNFGWVYLK